MRTFSFDGPTRSRETAGSAPDLTFRVDAALAQI